MSTTASPSHGQSFRAPAPWRKDFTSHIDSLPMPTFVLATSHGPHTPRARTCVYRGLWGTLLPNSRNPAPKNPDIFESDLPVFTTDARMEKAGELCSGPLGEAGNHEESNDGLVDTGGGGAVEAVFWASEHGTQWRIRGRAYLLGPEIDTDGGSELARKVKTLLRSKMRRRSSDSESQEPEGAEKEWSFTREITAHFGNLSPAMRGTFRHPPPGRPLATNPPPEDDHLGLGKKVEDLDDPVARKNFRVVVIVPEEVDRTDLSDPEHPRRWLYSFRGDGNGTGTGDKSGGGEVIGDWEVVEVWP
ncbi:hypothetical protein V8F20_007397 [Naviculisporaceae sp. PSN 640]